MLGYVNDYNGAVNDQRINTMFVMQHAQMLVVRKEGKAHDQYNSFRSAFELMESVGNEPSDSFSEMTDDALPPLEMLEKRMMIQHKALLVKIHEMETEIHEIKTENSQLKDENIDLRCRLEKLERRA